MAIVAGPRPQRRIRHGSRSSLIRPGGPPCLHLVPVLHQPPGRPRPLPDGTVTVRDAPSGRGAISVTCLNSCLSLFGLVPVLIS